MSYWRSSTGGGGRVRPSPSRRVVDGVHVGAKLLVGPGRDPAGSLGEADLDRVTPDRDQRGYGGPSSGAAIDSVEV